MLGISYEESLESGWGELRHLTSPQRNHREGTAWRFGVESNSPMSQILSTLSTRILFLHRKKTCRSFFREDEGATPLTNESATKPPKKTRKTGVSGGCPFWFHKVDVIFVIFATDQSLKLGGKCSSREKKQCPFSINPFSMVG